MYLEHFKFSEFPFGLTPNLNFFCMFKGYQDALNLLLFSLRSGEGFIKIIGEVGLGKTLLCRKLLDSLGEDFVTAYLPNPDLQPIELRKAFARELGIDVSSIQDQHELLVLLNNKLLQLHSQGKRVVLLIDEAQSLPKESLESLRLLTNLETETHKLLQVVLFGQPELNKYLNHPSFRQLKQRISFSYTLPPLNRDDLDIYLNHRIAKAGFTMGTLFTKKARSLLYRSSQGLPRIVNILCHKALLLSYGRGESNVTGKMMRLAIRDTDVAHVPNRVPLIMWPILLGIITGWILYYYSSKGII